MAVSSQSTAEKRELLKNKKIGPIQKLKKIKKNTNTHLKLQIEIDQLHLKKLKKKNPHH